MPSGVTRATLVDHTGCEEMCKPPGAFITGASQGGLGLGRLRAVSGGAGVPGARDGGSG